ncbi:MAG: CPBP family intramembrane metalloprotease [Lachnospiraceae bacterium]|nr:CPBP family intramembrane metalloprotease [Lachnospiraceae bacterium]
MSRDSRDSLRSSTDPLRVETGDSVQPGPEEMPADVGESGDTGLLTGTVETTQYTSEEGLTREQVAFSAFYEFGNAVRPMITYLLCCLVCVLIGYVVLGGGRGLPAFLTRYGNFFTVLGTILTFRRLYKKSKAGGSTFFEDASLYRTELSLKKTIGAFLFGSGMALFLSAILTLLPRFGPVKGYVTHVGLAYQQWDVFLSMAASVLFTPLVEEIIFRGYMLNRLLQKWRELTAILVTTFVFALMHGSILWFAYAFCMGYLLAKLSIREDNIFYGIFMHAGFNLPSTVLWLIYVNVPGSEEALSADRFLITLLGTAGGLVALLMWRLYKMQRKVLPV